MYRFMSIRIGAIAVLVAVVLFCFLTTTAFAATIVPINGNKKIYDPGPTPYWDMGEPGSDPGLIIGALQGSGNHIDHSTSFGINSTPTSNIHAKPFYILQMLLLRMGISIFNYHYITISGVNEVSGTIKELY